MSEHPQPAIKEPRGESFHPTNDQILRRLVRMETRLAKLMNHLGLKANGEAFVKHTPIEYDSFKD